jgi:hypothetical protein
MISSSKLECWSHCSGAYEKISLEQFSYFTFYNINKIIYVGTCTSARMCTSTFLLVITIRGQEFFLLWSRHCITSFCFFHIVGQMRIGQWHQFVGSRIAKLLWIGATLIVRVSLKTVYMLLPCRYPASTCTSIS